MDIHTEFRTCYRTILVLQLPWFFWSLFNLILGLFLVINYTRSFRYSDGEGDPVLYGQVYDKASGAGTAQEYCEQIKVTIELSYDRRLNDTLLVFLYT